MSDTAIKIEHVSKQYVLGQIGGTTLKEEIQRRRAKRRGQADPTAKIGMEDYHIGDTFMALDDVSFDVRKGERVGLIGANGAGKSTLLKLITRITAPTSGRIGINGRITSMLEVGTGFHAELTGRENIYMNGAILGMSKKETDDKVDQIIAFSECEKFIDTPVKRYSSGMFVKLAFAVAAHLDSEIMIMDEVLAVGDMAFQEKCLNKMKDLSTKEGRTILYVSHNMNTIRSLCDRCVVLQQGKKIFDGEREKGIRIYLNSADVRNDVEVDLDTCEHDTEVNDPPIRMKNFVINNKETPVFYDDEELSFDVLVDSRENIDGLLFKISFYSDNGLTGGTSFSNPFSLLHGENKLKAIIPLWNLPKGTVNMDIGIAVLKSDQSGYTAFLDYVSSLVKIEVLQNPEINKVIWVPDYWGVRLPETRVEVVSR